MNREMVNMSSSQGRGTPLSNLDDDEQSDDQFKLLVIGDSGVGKSCIVNRFTSDRFVKDHLNTIGVDFRIQRISIDNKQITLQIWDSAGYERFRIVASSYYRGADGIVMVYDVTNKASFDHLPCWLKEAQMFAPDGAKIVMIGNKCDLSHLRTVSPSVVEQFSKTYKIKHMETSARTGENVDDLFYLLSSSILKKRTASITWSEKHIIESTNDFLSKSKSYEVLEIVRKLPKTRTRTTSSSANVQKQLSRKPRRSTVTSVSSSTLSNHLCCCTIL